MKNIKNLKVRLLSILTAMMIAGTPVLGNAENDNSSKNEGSSFTLIKKDRTAKLTFEDYAEGVERAYNEAKKYRDSYESDEELQYDVQELFYLMSRAFITKSFEEEISDYVNINATDVEKFISEEKLIKGAYLKDAPKLKNGVNEDEIFDLSKFCFNENDKNIVKNMIVYLTKVYENGEWNDQAMTMLFKTLTTLNTNEGMLNAEALSVGSRTFSERYIGELAMYAIRSRIVDEYLEQLPEYYEEIDFKNELLNREAWKLKEDVKFDFNCLTDLERLISMHLQLEEFCVKNVYTDLRSAYTEFEYGERNYMETASITLQDFENCAKSAYDEVDRHLSYGVTDEAKNRLEKAICCTSYLANIDSMPKDVEDELVLNKIIFQTDGNVDFYQNVMSSLELEGLICDQVQSMIKYTSDIYSIVDVSKFLCNKEETRQVRELEDHLVKSYSVSSNGKDEIFNEEEFQKFYNGAMSINKENSSIGMNYINDSIIMSHGMQVLRFYFENNYLRKTGGEELYYFFESSSLNGEQWKLKDVDFNSLPDSKLKKYVEMYANMYERRTNAVTGIMDYLSVKVNGQVKTK